MIRKATKDDCTRLAALSIKVWLDTYAKEGIKAQYAHYALSTFTVDYFIEILSMANYCLLISEEEEVLQGFVLVNLDSHYNTPLNGFEVEKLYIDNIFTGQGIGRELLNEIQSRIGNIYWLYTWIENESNEFYEHLGFQKIGTLEFDFADSLIVNNVYQSPS